MANGEPKYPQVKVELVGQDGNAFAILGRVTGAMRRAGLSADQRNEFMAEAMSGDYDHLLQTVMEFVTVDDEVDEDGHLWGYVEEEDEEEEE